MAGFTQDGTEMSHGARLARYGEVSTALALLSDRRLGQLVDGARSVKSGIGGTQAVLDIAGVPVFVKRIPLTDLERRPENVMSTANMFGLPPFCQYGSAAPASGHGGNSPRTPGRPTGCSPGGARHSR
ncbi:hypothetical protein ABGB16_30825 [Micromonospora sp. B11E3]|uniref:hypothetical protein n=1 Tax=Micromonospora sp. B11E3 TaxID=3153562 RepID=UPI00325C54C6